MRKTGTILLITILLMQSGGMLMVYKVQRRIIQHEMQQKIINGKSYSEKITISIEEFQKCKISHNEILLSGKIYDIKSMSKDDKEVVLLAINDSEEENNINKRNDFFKKKGPPFKKLINHLRLLLSSNFITPETEKTVFISRSSTVDFHHIILDIISKNFDISSPPPELV